MTSRRSLKNITTRPGGYQMGGRPGDHELVLYGDAAEPAVVRGRGTETHLSAADIREHVLVFVAEHPDEFGPAVRAIVTLWDKTDLDRLNEHIHTFSLSDRERVAFRRAAVTGNETSS